MNYSNISLLLLLKQARAYVFLARHIQSPYYRNQAKDCINKFNSLIGKSNTASFSLLDFNNSRYEGFEITNASIQPLKSYNYKKAG